MAVNEVAGTVSIQNQIAVLERQFRCLNRKIQDELEKKEIFVSHLLSSLTLLPAEITMEYKKAISEMFPNLRREPTITDLFYHLTLSLTFLVIAYSSTLLTSLEVIL